MEAFDLNSIIEGLRRWWPALVVLVAARYFYRRFRLSRRTGAKLDSESLALHQVKVALACDTDKARKLLAAYDGNAAQAILEVKTGRAALPGSETGEVPPVFAGEIREMRSGESRVMLVDYEGKSFSFQPETEGFVICCILNSDQRPDKHGYGQANRGRIHTQMFLPDEEGWRRYRLDSGRIDYSSLGERMQNQACRNYQTLLEDFLDSARGLARDSSVERFLEELRAPILGSQADFEKVALRAFRGFLDR